MRKVMMLVVFFVLVGLPAKADTIRYDACAISSDIDGLSKSKATAKLMGGVLAESRTAFAQLCQSQPGDQDVREGRALVWLVQADEAAKLLIYKASAEQEKKPQTRDTLDCSGFLTLLALKAQVGLNGLRAAAYQAVRTETKEVVRTVEVAAQCPVVESPQQSCGPTLRSAARRWANALDEFTGQYICQGCADWTFAKDTASTLYALSYGGNTDDPVPVVIGWLAQYRQLARGEQTRIDDRVKRVAADMRAQLAYCGMQQYE
jgi:hypothetical protein